MGRERSARKRARKRQTRRSAQVHTRARQQTRTLRAQTLFLQAFTARGIVLRACQAAKVGRRTVYDWLSQDEAFKERYEDARIDAIDALEDEARRRAVDGVLKPVFQGGRKVGTIREYSDSLLDRLLRGKRPEEFRDRYEHTGKDGAPLTFTLQLDRASDPHA